MGKPHEIGKLAPSYQHCRDGANLSRAAGRLQVKREKQGAS
jgi:hypothetical protein